MNVTTETIGWTKVIKMDEQAIYCYDKEIENDTARCTETGSSIFCVVVDTFWKTKICQHRRE